MIVLGMDTGKQEVHLRDYLSFAKSQCKLVVIVIAILAILFVVARSSPPPLPGRVLPRAAHRGDRRLCHRDPARLL